MPYLVLVQVARAEFLDRMATIRMWLDHQRWEPELFRFEPDADGMVFEVEFADHHQALGFARAFDGRVITHAPAVSAA
jgi:hypothetical protein